MLPTNGSFLNKRLDKILPHGPTRWTLASSSLQAPHFKMSIKAASPGAGLAMDLPELICRDTALPGVPHTCSHPLLQDSQTVRPKPHSQRKGFVWKWEIRGSPSWGPAFDPNSRSSLQQHRERVRPCVMVQELSLRSLYHTRSGLSFSWICQLLFLCFLYYTTET